MNTNTPELTKPTFEAVYESQYDRVWRFLLHATADLHTALELTSRTFFRALHAWPRYELRDIPIEAWILRIALNEWRRELRRRKLSRFIPWPDRAENEDEFSGLDVHEINEAAESLEKEEDYQLLRKALTQLPPKYETAIMLHYFEHLNFDEIATVLGRPVGTVKSLCHRGIARLRQDQGLRESLGLSYSEAKPVTTER
jgi:RNA polymerase sigma-70 factor, ECF subfamily